MDQPISLTRHIDWSKVLHPRCQVHVNGEVEKVPDIYDTSPPTTITPEDVSKTVYSRLDAWQTRLLRVNPGKYGEPIVTKLLPVDIIHLEGVVITQTRERIFYEAVSYSWGHPPLHYSITCSRERLPVNRGVFQALQRFRYEDKPRYLWIDAICINQLDPDEKSSQIRTMFSIFKKAFRVIVWLGELQEPMPGKLIVDFLQFRWTAADDSHCVVCQYELYNALVTLARQPFFSRTWVRQEIFAARDVVVQFGDTTMGWSAVQDIPERVEGLASALRGRIPWEPFPNVRWPGDLRRASDEELALVGTADYERAAHLSDHGQSAYDKTDLVRVLLRNKGFKAEDPRDFVYGAIGMTNVNLERIDGLYPGQSGPQNILPIDYKKTVSEVFQDATKYVIQRDRRLDILFVAWESRPTDTLELPSWTPDWRAPNLRNWSRVFKQIKRSPSTVDRESTNKFPAYLEKSWNIREYLSLWYLTARQMSLSNVLPLAGVACGEIIFTNCQAVLELRGHSSISRKTEPKWLPINAPPVGFRSFQFLRSRSRYFDRGCIPESAQEGDTVVAVHGFNDSLLLLRSVGDGRHTLVGPVLGNWQPLSQPRNLNDRERWRFPLEPIPDFLRRLRKDLEVFHLV